MTRWTAEQLEQIEGARELEIATRRPDGTPRPWLPIWVVCVGDQVYVRTWYRRTTGWFGHAVATRQARIRVPDLETDVIVEDVGRADSNLRSSVDEAYRAKYSPFGGSVSQMTNDEAAQTTLRLLPSNAASEQ